MVSFTRQSTGNFLPFFLEGRLQVICFLSKASKKIKNKKGPGGVGLSLALATGLF
jgi:hypothetical protein